MKKLTFWTFPRKSRATAAVIVIAMLLSITFFGCGNRESGGETDNASLPSEQQAEVSEQEHSGNAEPAPTGYRMTNSRGETLEAKPGYSYVSLAKVLSGSGRKAAIIIPTISAYTEKNFNMGSETEENGFCELVFSYDGSTDTDFLEKYAKDLSSRGFAFEQTHSVSSDQVVRYFNYVGKEHITHGADKYWDGTAYDMSVTGYRRVDRTVVIFRYPSEVGFDLNDSKEEYRAAEVLTDYSERQNGADAFKIVGWGESPKDEIYLWFKPDRYGTGAVIEQKDFAAQASAGSSGLCHISLYGDTVAGSEGICYADALEKATVTVIERSETACVISYAIDVKNGSALYRLEGICAAELSGGDSQPEPVTDSDSQGAAVGDKNCIHCHGKGKIKCTYCGGAGFTVCHTCGGDGMEQCSLCHGTCQYWSNGGYRTCNGCNGRGTKPCSSSRCNRGKVNCNFCNNGTKTCNYCLGRGK